MSTPTNMITLTPEMDLPADTRAHEPATTETGSASPIICNTIQWAVIGAPPMDDLAHSWIYLNNKLDAMDWRSGVTKHQQQFTGFLIAAGAAIPIEKAIPIILQRLDRAEALIDPQSVLRQAERAYEYVTGESGNVQHAEIAARKKRKPAFDHEALMAFVADVSEITDQHLRDLSPAWAESSSEFLAQIFEPGERAVVFDDMEARKPRWIWEQGTELGSLSGQGVWFLSNPVDGKWHPNPRNAGKQSCRSQESVMSFRYAVLECDHEKEILGVNALWLRYLARLPLPIAAIYTSGGKSIHALVRVDAATKKDWDAFRDNSLLESIAYGADPAALSAVRLTRLPFCRNLKHGTLQRLLFLNPEPTGRAICER